MVKFDVPLLPDINGLDVVHLQCHIATDTLSLARRGAKSVVGLDFSPASLEQARKLATSAAGGDKLLFVEASTYDALKVLKPASFDFVFTGIGALCWLPNVREWAKVVSGLLKPGGRFFIREGHPLLWVLDDKVKNDLKLHYTYFEQIEPMEFDDGTTYVELADKDKKFVSTSTMEWNHGIGEIIQALIEAGMEITGMAEHTSVPWEALRGQMVNLGNGEFALKEGRERLPLTYTIQAMKKA